MGSPYTQQVFATAKVTKINIQAFMRYNVFKDEMEFITPKNDTLVLDKIEDFGEIIFPGLNKKYVLSQFTVSTKLFYGYLIDVYSKGDYGLYKKENISLTEAKKAKTTLERDMPAKYNNQSADYYFKNKDKGISEFPDSKKALIKMFPDKKSEIESFLKEAKIDFSKEEDLIQIINLLAK